MNRRGLKTLEFLTKADPSVRVPRAETRLTVYRSPLVRMLPQLVGLFLVERACVKLDVFFWDLVMFRIQMCLGVLKIQILIILRLRSELLNDWNDRAGKKLYPRQNFQKWTFVGSNIEISETLWKLKFNWISACRTPSSTIRQHGDRHELAKQENYSRKKILLYVSPERKPGWRFTARPS